MKRIVLPWVALVLLACGSAQRKPAQEEKMRYYARETSGVCELVEHVLGTNQPLPRISPLIWMRVGPTQERYGLSAVQPMLRPFFSDGCSMSPNGIAIFDKDRWTHCCVAHDTAYWLGGPQSAKELADQTLRACLDEAGASAISGLYYESVHLFGGPGQMTNYRWGYGWTKSRGYADLTAADWEQIHTYYPGNRRQVEQTVFNETRTLLRTCGAYDPIFTTWTELERQTFEFLNQKLKYDRVVEWAAPGYSNSDQAEFNLRFRGCDKKVKVLVHLKPVGTPTQLFNDCDP